MLELLEAESVDSLFGAFELSMRNDFKTDHAAIIVFDDGAATEATQSCRLTPRDSAMTHLGSLTRSGKPACGALRSEEFNYLFPGAGGSGSAAIVPMRHAEGELGLIAVGSADAKRYHPQMGTIFLEHIAAVIARVMPRFLAVH